MNNTTSPQPTRVHRTLAFGAGIAATLAAGIVFAASGAQADLEPDESTFVPITPCRLFDTRPGSDNVGPRSTPIGAAETHTVQVTGANGDCLIPSDASAVAFNATAVGATAGSFATFHPADAERPLSSNLNYVPGQPPTPNKIDVKLSGDGKVDIYNHAGSVHILADVTGYYRDSGLQDLEQRVDAAQAARPTLLAVDSEFEDALATDDTVVLSIEDVAPVAGRVIADYTAVAIANNAGDDVICGLTDGDEIELRFSQQFESPGLDGSIATLGGSRVFDVDAGPFAINLVCRKSATASGIDRHNMTAMFVAD